MTLTGEMRSLLLRPYKGPAVSEEETKKTGRSHEPAPPWVAAVIDTLWPKLREIRDGQRFYLVEAALAWCARGEPITRAEQLITLVELWPGDDRGHMIELFLFEATRTRAGRPKHCPPKPYRAPRLRAAWGESSACYLTRRELRAEESDA